jgi:formylglycine-generating enzyme required for sulfatase activity
VTNAGHAQPTGERVRCVTKQGVYDLVGNVWEWTSATVREHTYDGRQLASSTGYVAAADSAGLPLATVSSEPPIQYGRDYAWLSGASISGVLRGGFFASGADAGIYAVHTGKMPTYRGQGVGFRCVK